VAHGQLGQFPVAGAHAAAFDVLHALDASGNLGCQQIIRKRMFLDFGRTGVVEDAAQLEA